MKGGGRRQPGEKKEGEKSRWREGKGGKKGMGKSFFPVTRFSSLLMYQACSSEQYVYKSEFDSFLLRNTQKMLDIKRGISADVSSSTG